MFGFSLNSSLKIVTIFPIFLVLMFGQIANAQTPYLDAMSTLSLLAPQAVKKYYQDDTAKLVWGDGSPISELVEALKGLEQHGLNPRHYHLEELQAESIDYVERDIYATDAWFAAAAHMLYGKLDAVSIEPDWTAIGRQADLVEELHTVFANNTIPTSLEQFAPKQKGYEALVREYAALSQQSSEPTINVSSGPTLKAGMTGDRVLAMQQRLVQLDFLESNTVTGTMDRNTVESIQNFQAVNELDSDGLVGPATLVALNRGLQEKLEKVRVNMERWRWLPDDLGRRHLRANIAGFNVAAWSDGELVRTHLIIVGKYYRKTPVFSDEIEYMIFNPWWEVPASIARADKLPLFRQDPSIVQSLGFQVLDSTGKILDPASIDWNSIRPGTFPYRLRQAPGDQNALGQVKIMFPNIHSVYLHDTPTRGLFSHRQRAFSSGCMRTQYPLDLAAWLLEETPGWEKNKIDATVASRQETRVNLTHRIPVHVLYFTAVNEEYGGVRYLDDIYQRDDAVLAGLRAAAN